MFSYVHDEVRRAVAEHLEIDPDDLEPLDTSETACTFRQVSNGTTHTAQIVVGPEGPAVTTIT